MKVLYHHEYFYKKKIIFDDKLLDIFSNFIGESVNFISELTDSKINPCKYYLEPSYNDFGFSTDLFLWHKEGDLNYKRNLDLKTLDLLKYLSNFYKTEAGSYFFFRMNILFPKIYISDYYTQGELFVCDKNGFFFHIQEDSNPHEKISSNSSYSIDELENFDIGVIPIYRKPVSYDQILFEINKKFDIDINNQGHLTD